MAKKKVEKKNVTEMIEKVMEETGTKNTEIAKFRGVTDSSNFVTIKNGTIKTDNLIDIFASMGKKLIVRISDKTEVELIKKVKK